MKPDYSETNPALDARVVPLFPFKPHLYIFMRYCLFHPDYAPFVPFGEQFPLAEKIVDDFKDTVLTVGDISRYVIAFVEKRNPSPPGVTQGARLAAAHRARTQNAPKSIPALADLFLEELKVESPEVNADNALTAIRDLVDECAFPKEGEAVTIRELWERSNSGTITAQQYSPQGSGTQDDSNGDNEDMGETRPDGAADFGLEDLFAIEQPKVSGPRRGTLTGLFSRQTIAGDVQSEEIGSDEKAIVLTPRVKTPVSLGGLFNRRKS